MKLYLPIILVYLKRVRLSRRDVVNKNRIIPEPVAGVQVIQKNLSRLDDIAFAVEQFIIEAVVYSAAAAQLLSENRYTQSRQQVVFIELILRALYLSRRQRRPCSP